MLNPVLKIHSWIDLLQLSVLQWAGKNVQFKPFLAPLLLLSNKGIFHPPISTILSRGFYEFLSWIE